MTEEERIAQYFDALVQRYGHDARAVDARSAESLELRYRVLAEIGDLNGKAVLEIGCGYGGLGAYLQARYPDVRYRGVDVSPRMIQLGREVNPRLDLALGALDSLGPRDAADVILAQGIFYLLRNDPERQMQDMIGRMWELAREALAFTTMSGWAPEVLRDEFFVAPQHALSMCRALTTNLVLRHDYHPADFAMYLFRADMPSA